MKRDTKAGVEGLTEKLWSMKKGGKKEEENKNEEENETEEEGTEQRRTNTGGEN